MTDLVIRYGTIVLPGGTRRADLAIEDGVISGIGSDLPAGRMKIDASGLHVLPGLIDVHVHFNEPGRTSWEGAASGSRALAAGGGTLFFEMPLNSTPCTIDAGAFDQKRAALEASAITDFALWGGLVPGSVRNMAGLADRGAIGFKAFMCDSGLPEFPRADDETLIEGMGEAARLGLPVAVHAESEKVIRSLAERTTGRGARDFLSSRPVSAELDAIRRALRFARDTGAALYIVHVSSGSGVAMAAQARAEGVDVTIETCPHYLAFIEEDLERLGALAKCAPPLRPAAERDRLWSELLQGRVDIVASDHSPAEPQMKIGDFGDAWGGIAGVQSTMPVLIDGGHHARGLPLERLAMLVAGTPARRFRIERKGLLEVGYDADLMLVELGATSTLEAGRLQQRHKVSPYIGMSLRGVIRRTIRRGETIFVDGRTVHARTGRFVRPALRPG